MTDHLKIQIEFIEELKLTSETKSQITQLLKVSFPEEDFHGRHYFKQLPHHRLILKDCDHIIGQLALDFRVMTLDSRPINVLGIIDLAILPEFRHQGMATRLMTSLIHQSIELKENIDFLLLATDQPTFYEKFGFKSTTQCVKWLVTEEHINYGLKEELVEDVLMYRKIGNKEWIENTTLDLMGYWY